MSPTLSGADPLAMAAWLGLGATADPARWRLPVRPDVCAGTGSLHGGSGLAACITALEAVTGRPLVWATAQYGGRALPPAELVIDVSVVAEGRQVTQAAAVGRVDGVEILAVRAALGRRPLPEEGRWERPPQVPPPEDCPLRVHHRPDVPSVNDRIEPRVARGLRVDQLPGPPLADGRTAFWVRLRDLHVTTTATLAVVGDVVTIGLSSALGRRMGGRSLDNTLRVVQVVPCEWILLDVRLHALAHGFVHGLVHLWSPAGQLLATASQSAMAVRWPDPPVSPTR